MNPLKLFYCQSILLVTLCRSCLCKSDEVVMATSKVQVVDGATKVTFLNLLLTKTSHTVDEYFFVDDILFELLGGKFTSETIEITYAFDCTVEFSLITVDQHFTITCEFFSPVNLQIFFSEIRKTVIIGDNNHAKFRKLFKFSTDPVVEVANDGILYRKEIHRPLEAGATESYNLVRVYKERNSKTGAITYIQEADLVFASRDFNITGIFEGDKLGLCVPRVSNQSIFVLRFTDRKQILRFFATLVEDANSHIPCSLDKNWIQQNISYIDSPKPFHLPHLPYLEKASS